MSRPFLAAITPTVLAIGALGCASAPVLDGASQVEELVAARIPSPTDLSSGDPSALVRELLGSELTRERAIQIALLHHPELRAEYQELGVSRAEVIEAGLLPNPVLSATARFPDERPRRAQLDLGIVQSLLDLLVRPARRQLAETQFERAQLRVADAVLQHAAKAEMAWLEAVAAAQVVEMRSLIRDSAEASLELALALEAAGNASELEVARERGLYESARIELARAEGEARSRREALNRALGLWGADIDWTAPSRLPELPVEEIPLDRLESHAIGHRLDLEALGRSVEARALALGIKKRWRYLLSAEVGVEAEREDGDEWAIGPTLDLELPIFDRGQADLLRLRSELEQSRHRLEALAVEIRSEVRELRDRLVLQRDLARHYREVVIPLRERTVELTQEQYNFMLVGAFELLLAKQEEYDAYQDYLEAVRDYHLTLAELKRALGGSLPGAASHTEHTGHDNTDHDDHDHAGPSQQGESS